MTWKKTGIAADPLKSGTMREAMVDMLSVLVVRVGPLVLAEDTVCPHLGGLLSDGSLAGRRLTCPIHEALFDAFTGEVLADPFGVDPLEGGVAPVASYPTRIESGLVEVDLP